MIKRALTRKLGLDIVRLPLVYLIMATLTKPQPLNPKALAVWAAAPFAVAGVVWLADRAALWGLGLWAVWVGIGILAPLPGLRRAWRRPAKVRPAQARRPAVKAPGVQRSVSPWAGPVKRQPQPPVVVDREQLEPRAADEERAPAQRNAAHPRQFSPDGVAGAEADGRFIGG
jgi:hypothetical protein